MIESGIGKNLLYRYLRPEIMKKQGWNHPDPVLEELTYGDSNRFGNMIRNNVSLGSHIFFHTTIGGQRYITGHYFVSKIMEGFEARHDKNIRKKFRNIHIHPENYPDWWPNYDIEKEEDSNDVIIFGDPKKSFGKFINPIPFDRDLAQRLEFEKGKKIEFEIINKKHRTMSDSECITSCTRIPRFITTRDVKFLLNEIATINGDDQVVELEESDLHQEISSIDNGEVELIKREIPSSETEFILPSNFSERDIENFLFRYPEALEKGLKILSRQESFPSGRVDLLFENKRKEIILLEIKEGFPRDSVITQVLSYMKDVEKRYPKKRIKPAILCQDCSERVLNAAKSAEINIYKYGTFLNIKKDV